MRKALVMMIMTSMLFLLAAWTVAPADEIRTQTFHGAAHVGVDSAGRLVVAIDEDDDADADLLVLAHLFEPAPDTLRAFTAPRATVAWTPGGDVTFVDGNGTEFLLSADARRPLACHVVGKRWNVNALAVKVARGRFGPLTAVRSADVPTILPSSAECEKGKPGEPGCSITCGFSILGFGATRSCSVNCYAGYHGCCNCGRCTCVYDGMTGCGETGNPRSTQIETCGLGMGGM